jgi:hypothetical protein
MWIISNGCQWGWQPITEISKASRRNIGYPGQAEQQPHGPPVQKRLFEEGIVPCATTGKPFDTWRPSNSTAVHTAPALVFVGHVN